MGSVCADQHKIHHSHQLFLSHKTLREVDIPPRKYLSRRATAASIPTETVAEFFMDSPKADEALLQKFLPYNNRDEADEADPYSSDHFRMYEFKVRRCTRSRSHDWTDCPFAHPGEKARRRDPRKYHYSGMVCSEFRRGSCSRGDSCEFAHGVFEGWLHPARYRTEACKDGKNCKRKVCFFAHSPRQLRVLPSNSGDNASPANSSSPVERKYRNATHCCLCCHPVSASPTSTLMGMSNWSPPMSPSLSPPLSPAKTRSICGFSPISRYADRMARTESGQPDQLNYGMMSYKDALTELMSSLESMNANESSHAASSNRNLSWVDVNFNNYDHNNQFTLSPSTVSPISSGSGNFFAGDSSAKSFIEENGGLADPDLGWVNELLT